MPLTTDSIAAQQIQDCLKSLYGLVHDIEKRRQQTENGINAIHKFHDNRDEKNQHYQQVELKKLYKTAIAHSEKEEELLRKALHKINDIRNIKNERRIQTRITGSKENMQCGAWLKNLLSSAQTLPLFVSKIGEKPAPLCGAIPAEPHYHAKVGDMVAALVRTTEEDGDNWILAEVVSFNQATNKYEVEDILEEQNQKDHHILSKKFVVPLPLMRANPETDSNALFPEGSIVMALFPQTTCFYKAVVNKLPQTHMGEYEVLFEDLSYTNGYSPPLNVAQRYVISTSKQRAKQT